MTKCIVTLEQGAVTCVIALAPALFISSSLLNFLSQASFQNSFLAGSGKHSQSCSWSGLRFAPQSANGVRNLSGSQGAHPPAFDALQDLPAQGLAAPFPQWLLCRMVWFHRRRVSQVSPAICIKPDPDAVADQDLKGDADLPCGPCREE